MSTNDKEPRSVMSRGKGDGQVVNGARMVKYRRFPSPHRGTWPVNPDNDTNSDPEPPPPSKRQKTKRERFIKGAPKPQHIDPQLVVHRAAASATIPFVGAPAPSCGASKC